MIKLKPKISTVVIIVLSIFLAVAIVGVIYAKVSSANTIGLLNSTISTITADKERVLRELAIAGGHVASLKDNNSAIESENTKLEFILVASKDTIEILKSENTTIRELLDRSINEAEDTSKLGYRAAREVDKIIRLLTIIRTDD